VISSEVAKRYAVGLFELAQEKNMLEQIASEIRAIGEVCKKDRTLLNFLAAPQIRDQEKEEIVHKIFEKKVSKPVGVFLDLIIRKRRSAFLIEICEAFDDLVLEQQGFIKTRVVTAIQLTDEESRKLQDKLEKKTGKKILMTRKVRPEIMGGMIVQLGDKVLDKSIRHEMRLLRDRLMELKVH